MQSLEDLAKQNINWNVSHDHPWLAFFWFRHSLHTGWTAKRI